MNTRSSFQAVCVTAAVLLLAGFPGRVQLQTKNPGCTTEKKNQYYRDFLAGRDGPEQDQAKALKAAKEYLACPADPSDPEQLLADLNLGVGRMLMSNNSSSDAIPYIIKAASYEDITVKTSSQTYADLAEAYSQGPYQKLSTAYRVRYEGQDESDESLLALENINQVIDRMIDAWARALALANVELSMKGQGRPGNLPGHLDIAGGPAAASEWLDMLRGFYTYRHNGSPDGLKDFIDTIGSKPLPPEPTPITSLPPRQERLNGRP